MIPKINIKKPKTKEELVNLIKSNRIPMDYIDVSLIRDMRDLFSNNKKIFGSIANWDVSNVTNMRGMFAGTELDVDISKWDVSSVKDMSWMFSSSKIHSDISKWDVSSVERMGHMFKSAEYIADITSWNTSSVQDMFFMFESTQFNQPIGNWNLSNAKDISYMFADTPFNQDISKWDVSSVELMKAVFQNSDFNQDISGWDISSVIDFNKMFYDCSKFDQNLGKLDFNINKLFSLKSVFANCKYSIEKYEEDRKNYLNEMKLLSDTKTLNESLNKEVELSTIEMEF